MKVRLAPIPKLAKIFYLIGVMALISSWFIFQTQSLLLSTLHTQQLFILGALLVSIGSVINLYFQWFKKGQNQIDE
ncbi:MAG: hypothetical protein COW84_02955 [Gammaproteobacteria bacterium CG22_combo_CG10-13_8_21_14_all_40_8]|nr:MAG: hypothetical protein COW84_02955 [Gammaproteobacteria bacterium CG22_combo_CG10-13_8_21_14_all_40_8]